MAVVKMLAVTLVGPKDEMEYVASQMVLMGGFQPLSLDLLLEDRNLRSRVRTVTENPYDELLMKLAHVWQTAGEVIPEAVPLPVPQDFTLEKARFEVSRVSGRLELWAKRRIALEEGLEALEAANLCVQALESRGMNLEELAFVEHLTVFFGKLSEENYKRLEESSQDVPLLVIKLGTWGQETWVLAFTIRSYADEAEKLLNSVYFKRFSLSDVLRLISSSNKPSEGLEKRIENLKRAIDGLASAAKAYLDKNREELERLFSLVYTMQRIYDLCRGRGEVGDMYVLSGWIPEDLLDHVRKMVEEKAPKSAILVEESKSLPYQGVRVPTFLRNLPLVRAFQDVVAMYSLPAYGEIDPSFFVAVSFCLFFGFMFGDVGHGLILLLAAQLMQKRRMIRRSLAIVLKSAAATSVFFGFLYGSLFGVEGILPALWLSPMENMGNLLAISVGIGVVMVTLGMVLNIISAFRRRDFGGMLFDGRGLAGLVFYLTCAAAIYASFSGKDLPIPRWILWALIALMLAVMLLRDVLARYLLKERLAPGKGVLNAFEVFHNLLSFLSNTISFLRLAAFALNHVGLSLAVLMLSHMVHALPGGPFFGVLVLVAGNAVIIALEGLIVFIQTLRLEYYEFFGKFYKGGGSAFRPVQWRKDLKALRSRSNA